MLADEYITVPVPKDAMPYVVEALSRFYGQGGQQVSAPSAPPPPAPDEQAWTPELMERMVEESPAGMKVLLEVLGNNPGRWITSEEFAEALKTRLAVYGGENKPNADWNTVAGTMGAFGRRIKSRYKMDTFPWDSRADQEGRWVHRADEERAKQLLELLSKT